MNAPSRRALMLNTSRAVPPLSIPDLWAWWDMSELSTLFQDSAGTTPVAANADPIGYIADRSGNGRYTRQTGLSTTRPTYTTGSQNNLPGASFDAGDYLDSLATLASIPCTLFVVGKRSATVGANMGLLSAYNTTTGGARLSWNASNQLLASTGNPGLTSRTPLVSVGANAPFIAVGQFGVSDSTGVLNTTSAYGAHATTAISNIVSLGRISATQTGTAYNGIICEALVYGRALSNPELSWLRSYLNTKWQVYR